MSKLMLFVTILLLIISFSYFIYINAKKAPSYTPGRWPEGDTAIHQAQNLYKAAKLAGVDFSTGPCLSNALMPGWVADIVHSPRQSVDEIVDNQCTGFLNGGAKHFVELDLDGNLVRIK